MSLEGVKVSGKGKMAVVYLDDLERLIRASMIADDLACDLGDMEFDQEEIDRRIAELRKGPWNELISMVVEDGLRT